MGATPRIRGLPVFGFAAAGLLLGHGIAYLLAVPDPNHRSLLLERSGHDYLPVAGQIGLILLVAGIAAMFASAWTRRGRDQVAGFASLARTLTLGQVAAFTGQELLERLIAGSPIGGLGRVLAIGVIVQFSVALVFATALRWLARASARFARAGAASFAHVRRAACALLPTASSPLRGRAASPGPNVRAPPFA